MAPVAMPGRTVIEFNSVELEGNPMGRHTAVLGFSVNPELAREYERLAAQEGTTKSELFRRMIECYKTERDEEEFFKLQRRMARRAQKPRALTEKEVERTVFEDR